MDECLWLLKTSDNRRFYHRGHPILKRFDDNLNEKKFSSKLQKFPNMVFGLLT